MEYLLKIGVCTFLVTGLLSAFAMTHYLVDRGFYEKFSSNFRPDAFLVYREMTKKEYGKTGFWFPLFFISMLLFAIFFVLCVIFIGHAEVIN